jgi:uncharacterized membrane protein
VKSPEVAAARVLLVGGIAGVAVMVLGVLLAVLEGEARLPTRDAAAVVQAPAAPGTPHTPVSAAEILRGLTHRPVNPLAIAALGIVTLFVTPVVAVAAAGLAFLREGDTRFVVISAIVVALLLLSFALGGV